MTISELYADLWEGVVLALSYFLSPNKRIFWGYLVTSLLLAFVVYRGLNRHQSFWAYVFPRKNWWGNSPTTDYGFFILNGIVKVVFLSPLFMWGLYLSFQIKEWLLSRFGYVDAYWNTTFLIVAYTIVLFVARDLTFFLVHTAMHKIPVLWRFHKVHHSATVLNPITQYRIHPIELLINNASNVFCIALVTGFFDFLYGGKLPLITILGVNVFTFIFLLLGANLRHSHIALTFPHALEKVLISPYQHQIHHSENQLHYDKNMGSALAIWDALMGSLIRSREAKKIRFGLGKSETDEYYSFWDNLLKPFYRR